MRIKFKKVFLPFVCILLLTLCAYSYLNFNYLTKYSSELRIILFPLLTSTCVIFLFLAPRIKKLNWVTFYYLSLNWLYNILAILIIWIVILTFQNYINTSGANISNLVTIQQLNKTHNKTFIVAPDLAFDKQNVGLFTTETTENSGRMNQTTMMHIYLAVPVFAKKDHEKKAITWIGLSYSKTLKNGLSPKIQELEYAIFKQESEEKFNALNLNNTKFLQRLDRKVWLENLPKAIINSALRSNSTQFYEAKNNTIAVSSSKALETTIWSFVIGSLFFLLVLVVPELRKEKL
jgi:hypothetical protein